MIQMDRCSIESSRCDILGTITINPVRRDALLQSLQRLANNAFFTVKDESHIQKCTYRIFHALHFLILPFIQCTITIRNGFISYINDTL